MLIIYAMMLVAAVGLAVKYGLPFFVRDWDEEEWGRPAPSINWTEYAIGVVVMTILFAVIINPVGTNMARSNSLKFKEFWNGYETSATHQRIPCDRDGPCAHEYNCDPYNHVHHHPATYDSKGNMTSPAYDENHTHYHSCPYSTEEWTFEVDTTLGGYTIASHIFPDNPQEWRGGSGIPGGVPRGIPPFWQAAKDRLDAGNPGPVTVRKTYDNYILASQHTILKKWSSSIEQYRVKGMMPKPATDVHSHYWSDKLYFAGMPKPGNYGDFRFALEKVNAALGSDLQGDLHVVVVPTRKVVTPDEYSQALFAYWQSPDLGRQAASKNTITLVLGVNAGKVMWARADTGMPLGNELLMVDFKRALIDKPFTPAALFGETKVRTVNDNAKVTPGDGIIPSTLWGQHKFERVCMTCKDDEGKTGFTYLKGQIPLKSGQKTMILLVTFFLTLIVWAIMGAVDLKIPDVISINLPKIKRGT